MVGREGAACLAAPRAPERELMDALAILDLADRPLGRLPLAIQQRTEIARALARDARVFLFDEPNSALTDEESKDLFRAMHRLAEAGRVVMLVSHRLGELVETRRAASPSSSTARARASGGRGPHAGRHRASSSSSASGRGDGGSRDDRRRRPGSTARLFRVSGWTHRTASSTMSTSRSSGRDRGAHGRRGLGRPRTAPLVRGARALRGIDPESMWPRATPATAGSGLRPGDAAMEPLSATSPSARTSSSGSGFRRSPARSSPSRKAAYAGDRRGRGPRFLIKTRTTRPGHPFAVRRQPAEGRHRPGPDPRTEAAAPGRADPRRRHPEQARDLSPPARVRRGGNAVIMFCTEVLEIFEAADRVIVVSDGTPFAIADGRRQPACRDAGD